MTLYTEMTPDQLELELKDQQAILDDLKSRNLHLDMSRGKPSSKQLDISTPMLSILKDAGDCFSEDGTDCRNYGVIDGIPEAKRLMACMLDDEPENVIVFGNSSLTVMYDTIARCLDFGCLGSKSWSAYDSISFICPVPGYDRHFTILEQFGIDMISVPMTETGPDMDAVEKAAASNENVKGIWCVPKYQNPTGVTLSAETVRRLASMKCAADDFRIFWDNAYCVHDIYPDRAESLLDIGIACTEAGTYDRYFKFASTSKVTFPGAGISGFAASKANVDETKRLVSAQMIGADKLNQLRHARYLPDENALMSHMAKLADIIRPKFELVESRLSDELDGLDIASWTDPVGGYFVSFDGLDGTAARTVALAADAGVKLTNAGATFPYGDDPQDRNIRIAPTMPSIEELKGALDVFVCCVKVAALEKLISDK